MLMGNASVEALRVNELYVRYGAITAVKGVSFEVGQGEAVAVIGSNGAGKTSMLKGLMGLASATSSGVMFHGRPIQGVATHKLTRLGIGYVPEGRELFPGLTVREELLIGGRHLSGDERRKRLDEVHALFPRLQEREAQITSTLSGGEQQMVAIARTLMMSPRLLLLDEPSLGLAPVVQDVVYAALAALKRSGLSMLLVEQNAHRAFQLCDRAYVLELGQFARQGPSDALKNDAAVQRAYLGG
jgi:branched-chain amino acid transport system ATP-binding protein